MSSWNPLHKKPVKRDLSKVPKFKLVLLGDSGVGKTTICKRFNNKPITDTGSTIGCSFLTHFYQDLTTRPVTEFRLDMWDTAGQERYFSLVDIYFKDCDVVLMVYDIRRPETLRSIFDRWLPQYLKSRYCNQIDWEAKTPDRQKIIYLIGNKADEDSDETILSLLKTNRFLIDKYDIKHIQFSALNGRKFSDFLNSLYQELIRDFLPEYPRRLERERLAKTGAFSVESPKRKRRLFSCCLN